MKVLVVDDDEIQRTAVTRNLAKLGVDTVVEAYDGLDAISSLGSNDDFDLVITDARMPLLDGLCLAHAIRRKGLVMMVAIMTGADSEGLSEKAIDCGADEFFVKPISSDGMEETLTKIVAQVERSQMTTA